MKRNTAIDALRGFAILLMAVDHLSSLILYQQIGLDSIRLPTRLAEPLFVLLFGYFLTGRGGRRYWRRVGQVVAAALVDRP